MRNRCYQQVFLIVLSLAFVFLGCGGGGGGGGDGDEGPFDMAAFFPLRSSWHTDNWTLMVDAAEYDVNGVLTKPMVDTRDPTVYFWTNDENGWQLHGFIDEDGLMVVFEPPILFMDSSCSVGDTHEGAFMIDGLEISYSIELVGVENVSVPAGTFRRCLKFNLKLWPSSELPSLYGTETFWLAENVGFVKGKAEDGSISDLFTDENQTRKLLSYQITPSNPSAEEQDLREAYMELAQYWEEGDINLISQMIHPQYQDERCRDRDSLLTVWENFHNDIVVSADFVALEDVQINGDEAVVLREELFGYVPKGEEDIIWEWSRVLRKWKKDGAEWKYYGVHTDDFRPSYLGVWSRNETGPGERNVIDAEFLKCGVDEWIDDPPDVIQSLTVSGPPGSGIDQLDLKPYWLGGTSIWRIFWAPDELQNAVSGFYTFRVEDLDGDYFVFTDYLEATPQLAVPVHVSPADGAGNVPVTVTLDWDPVDLTEEYRVDMQYSTDGGSTWMGMPNQYTFDTQFSVDLDPGTLYLWRVRARRFDVYGEMDTESRSDWSEFQTAG